MIINYKLTTSLFLILLLSAGCGPGSDEIEATIQSRVAAAVGATIAALPAGTPCPLSVQPSPLPETLTESPFNVQGRLIWDEEPISGVEVQLATNGEKPYIAITNAVGEYLFLVPPGEYRLSYRFSNQVDWISGDATPYFSPYHYIEEPVRVIEGQVTALNDIHTIKLSDLQITNPKPGQKLSQRPTIAWKSYPDADHYQVWLYEMSVYQGAPVLIPVDISGNPGETRQNTITFDQPLPIGGKYDVWVIAYNSGGHELADAHSGFEVTP